jgi:hypothetical protein
MKKGQGLVPSTTLGTLITVAFLVLMVAIAIIYKDQLLSWVEKIIGLIRFGG